MKGYRWALLVSLLLVLLAACGSDDKGGTKTFYEGGISLDLPGGWMADADDLEGGDYGRITLYSSKKIREAKSADDVPKNAVFGAILLSPLYDFELEDGPEGSLRSYLELEGGLPEDAEFHELEINGYPATRYTTTEEQNGLEGYVYNVGIFYAEKIRVYVLLYGFNGEHSTFDTTFEKLIHSITVDVEKLIAQMGE